MARWMGWAGLWLAVGGIASAQTMVEYGLGAGRAATTTAPAAGIGKALSGLAEKAGATTDAAGKAAKSGSAGTASPAGASSKTTAAGTAAAPAGAATAKWEDPAGIEAGLSYADLVKRFGPPSLEISGETGKTLTYTSKAGSYHVDIADEKVAEVRRPK